MKREEIVKELRAVITKPAECHLYSADLPRWMPAVFVRKRTIREILKIIDQPKRKRGPK